MKRIFLYIIFIFTAFTAAAQPGDGDIQNPKRAEKIRALYVAYISQQLQFTPAEAQRFWPLHQQFESEMTAINNSNLADLDKQQRILDLKRKYQPQFEGVIGRDRANNFYKQNDQFRDKLIQVRQRRQEQKAEGIRPNENGFRKGGGLGIKRQNMLRP